MREVGSGVVIECEVKANSRSPYVSFSEETLYISVSSAPVDNRANKEVIQSICEIFSIKKTSVSIISGSKSKFKSILLSGVDKKKIEDVLQSLNP